MSRSKENSDLFATLQTRFEQNMHRHKNIKWSDVLTKLNTNDKKVSSLAAMERTGGEPDVVGYDKKTGEYLFVDCSPESPAGRRSVCFDQAALNSRKEHKPKNSAVGMADEMGIAILTEEQYYELQKTGPFDTKTSSWIATPDDVRSLGGALFGDCRFGRVFTYHNGAESYYGARGFRGSLRV
jgi:hypothetical protein